MKASELYESDSDQTANILLIREIKRLRQLSITFKNMLTVKGHGYASAYSLPKLNNLDSAMWFIQGNITNNIKLQKLYNNYLNERTNLINKINSGV